ncbi:transglycosylase SLT domain-containing protein [Arenibacterium sp. CAU 1754]
MVITASSLHAGRVDMQVSAMCDQAAVTAARDHGVPVDVMRAITRTETGRTVLSELQPWPWTVNMEGAGRWFATKDEARAFVFSQFKRGARSFDVGCFQINYKWHGTAFRSIDEMFDPTSNADYAARFLARLHGELGDWSLAAGAFHSRTPEYARIYTARFNEIRDRMQDTAEQSPSKPKAGAQQALGLKTMLVRGPFIGQGRRELGSLVPTALSDGRKPTALIALK